MGPWAPWAHGTHWAPWIPWANGSHGAHGAHGPLGGLGPNGGHGPNWPHGAHGAPWAPWAPWGPMGPFGPMGPRLHNGPGINPLQRNKRETPYIYIYICFLFSRSQPTMPTLLQCDPMMRSAAALAASLIYLVYNLSICVNICV